MAEINLQDIIEDFDVDTACKLYNQYSGMSIYLASKPNQIIEVLYERGLSPKEISDKLRLSTHKVHKILASISQRQAVREMSLFSEDENNDNQKIENEV